MTRGLIKKVRRVTRVERENWLNNCLCTRIGMRRARCPYHMAKAAAVPAGLSVALAPPKV